MSSQGSHDNMMNRAPSGNRDGLDNDPEGNLTIPKKYSILSGYLHSAARHAKGALLDVPRTVLPSFLLSRLRTSTPSSSSSHTRSTSALDGIRGLAFLAVLNHHILWVYQPLVHYGCKCFPSPNFLFQVIVRVSRHFWGFSRYVLRLAIVPQTSKTDSEIITQTAFPEKTWLPASIILMLRCETISFYSCPLFVYYTQALRQCQRFSSYQASR